ncbi:unnamed protein product [Rhizopus stolonifer]
MERPQKEKVYNAENLTELIKEIVEEVLGDSPYTHAKVSAWNNSIIEGCLKKLKEKNKNHKYVVTCVIAQRKGTGFYAGSSVYWDNESDADKL